MNEVIEGLTYHRGQPVGEKAAPWYLRQAEYDGIAIGLASVGDSTCREPKISRAYAVGVVRLPWLKCDYGCGYKHVVEAKDGDNAWTGDDLAEAEEAYAELERKLLAGEL